LPNQHHNLIPSAEDKILLLTKALARERLARQQLEAQIAKKMKYNLMQQKNY